MNRKHKTIIWITLGISVLALLLVVFIPQPTATIEETETKMLTVEETNALKEQYPEILPNATLHACPGEERVKELFATLETGLPEASYDEKLTAWNDLMKRNGCHEFVIPYGEPIELMRRATTTDTPGYFVMDCPGFEFVNDWFGPWIVQYEEANPDATYEEQMADWDKLLRAAGCDEYTSDKMEELLDSLPGDSGNFSEN